MSIIKPSEAFPSADWTSGDVRSYMKDQTPIAVDTVADVNDNDFEQTRWLFVKANGSYYRLNLSSVAADDGDSVLQDSVGRRYQKLVATGAGSPWDVQVADIAARAAYDDEDPGFAVMVSDTGDGRAAVYTMGDGGSADWSDPAYFTGLGIDGAPGSSDVVGTSTSSVAIGTGTKTFTIAEDDRGWGLGARLRVSSDADGGDFMEGVITAYSVNTLELAVDLVGGSGTNADWTINLAGERGAPGANGTDGVMASIVAGTGITVDATDPANPVVSATGGGGFPTVQDYGAVGSPTDDAVAFQAAGDGDEMVLVPAGSYVLGSDITPTDGAFLFAPNAVLDDYSAIKPRGFWADEDNGVNIWRFRDRVMVGQAVYHDGNFTQDQDTWLGEDAGYHWLERTAQLHVAHDRGGTAILGTGRTSDKAGMVGQTLIGVAGYVEVDADPGSAWAGYFETVRRAGTTGNLFGLEVDAANMGALAGATSPYNIFTAGSTIGIWLGAGGDPTIHAGANDSSAAIVIGAGAARWVKGIQFQSVGLTGTDGDGTGTATAIEMARGHEIVWRHSSTAADTSGRIRSDNNSHAAESRIVFESTGLALKCLAADLTTEITMAQFLVNSGGANAWPTFNGGSSGASIGTAGGATNPDGFLQAKGTGIWYATKDDAFNSSVVRTFGLRHTTSGTPANGIGVGLSFLVETSASNNEFGAYIDALTTDVTGGSEDFDLRFSLMAAGAAAVEMMRLTSTGYLFVGPTAASEGVVAAKQIVTVQGSAVALTNNITTAQSLFASANDALTVLASTTYRFKGKFFVNTGTTTHTTAFGFGGTATATSIRYQAKLWSGTSGTINTTAPSVVDHNALTAKVLNATSGAAFTLIEVEGIVRVNAGGTLIPQITFSAGPTGTCEVAVDSFLELVPIGSNTVAAVGAWA